MKIVALADKLGTNGSGRARLLPPLKESIHNTLDCCSANMTAQLR
jgi:hypothetical protein